MARPLRIDYPGAYHHVINRGNNRQAIVRDNRDRERFLETLRVSVKTYAIRLHAFVLMANHFHLLLESPRGNTSEFMRRFNIAYTAQFNRRHKRTGHLYQGRFKSVLVDRDEYLSVLSRYVHLNPVRTKAWRKKDPKEQAGYVLGYPWGSLPGYVAKKKRLDFVVYDGILEEYGGDTAGGRRRYRDRVLGELGAEMDFGDKVVGQSILGSSEFVSWVRGRFLGKGREREKPGVRAVLTEVDPERLIEVVCRESGCGRDEVLHGRGHVIRDLAMELLSVRCGLANVAIAKLMGVDYSTVSLRRKGVRERLSRDRKLRELERRIGEGVVDGAGGVEKRKDAG